jgi:hypothetical protein
MTTFNHVSSIGQKNAIAGLEDNIKHFLDWSFVNIGGFINIQNNTSGLYGSNFNTLKSVNDPSIPVSRVWEGIRKDWIYESGISFGSSTPISISGIRLNSVFIPGPTGSGAYTYNINYPLGRIVFDNNVSSNSNIQIDYSYRYVQTYKANESLWWKEVQSESYNPANFSTSGNHAITANHRAQLPAILIETIPRTVLTPRELGTTQNVIVQDVLCHIFTENINQRNNIAEILVLQKDKTLGLYDVNKVVKNNVYPLNKNGTINPSGLDYPTLSSNYLQHWCTIKDSSISELNTLSNSLYNGIVRWSIEIFP